MRSAMGREWVNRVVMPPAWWQGPNTRQHILDIVQQHNIQQAVDKAVAETKAARTKAVNVKALAGTKAKAVAKAAKAKAVFPIGRKITKAKAEAVAKAEANFPIGRKITKAKAGAKAQAAWPRQLLVPKAGASRQSLLVAKTKAKAVVSGQSLLAICN